MLDLFLAWAVIFIPTALAIIFIFIPGRHENEKAHMRWRYLLVLVGILFSGVAWWQQSRAMRVAAKDREDAIKDTAQRVAAETSRSVTKTITELYTGMIAEQRNQIGDLRGELAKQGKKVDIIKESNIVTGKNPIKVEVTNPSGATGPLQVENLRVFQEQETSTHADAPYAKKITIQADAPINPIRLTIFCDVALKYGEGGPTGSAIFVGGNEIYKQDAKVFIINMESQGNALLRPDAALVFHLYSDKPINILKVERGPR